MKIIKPFQLGVQSSVIEHNNKFYFVTSSTLGINLLTGNVFLESQWMEDAINGMAGNSIPDTGMPKPSGEYLVSGSYYSPNVTPVTGGEIKVQFGTQEKTLLIFGDRRWNNGFPSKPELFTTCPINFNGAFGGKEFIKNPNGLGFKDTLLPRIENLNNLITSSRDQPEPAGLSVLDPAWPQRSRYLGSYDDQYMKKYFPGYPADFDWRFFHCAPQDQWHDNYYQGNESFEIHNMHPEKTRIAGKLPGLYARCFINSKIDDSHSRLSELDMNLDTVWFFPEQELGLLIWRATVEVKDDEASEIKQLVAAYENRADTSRKLDHYQKALELRLNSDDGFLNNFKTRDLIAEGEKTAMALLFEDALGDTPEQSELTKNLSAKVESVTQSVQTQVADSMDELHKGLSKDKNNDIAALKLPDIDELLSKKSDLPPDVDVDLFKQHLEEILPGVTKGDPREIDFSDFSFSKIDEIMAEMNQLMVKKEKRIDQEIDKLTDQLSGQFNNLAEISNELPKESKDEIESLLSQLNNIKNNEKKLSSPLPRFDADEIISSMTDIGSQTVDAMQQLQALKGMDIDNEQTQQLEKLIGNSYDEKNKQLETSLKEAEKDFRSLYIMSAHFMDNGTPPHKEDLDQIVKRLLDSPQNAAEKDWACIDLSNQNLDGINLSGAYLEQVNFSGASLVGANLSGAILSRANLAQTNFTGANLEGANIGAVHAHKTNFTDTNLHSAKLSRGDFTGANFTRATITDIESLEIIIQSATFNEAELPDFNFIELNISGVSFIGANLSTASFMKCSVHNCDFSNATLNRSTWADSQLQHCRFDHADMTSNCFVTTDDEFTAFDNMSFKNACVEKCNFQNLILNKAIFTHAKMDGAIFNGADLTGADFTNALAKFTQFRGAKLTHAKMDNINLMEGSLAKAHLSSASLTKANLYAVDFLRATLGNTDFSGAYLEATIIKDWRPS